MEDESIQFTSRFDKQGTGEKEFLISRGINTVVPNGLYERVVGDQVSTNIPYYTNYNTEYSSSKKTTAQEIHDLKNALESANAILRELTNQVKSLSDRISSENKLKHERRRLGGDE